MATYAIGDIQGCFDQLQQLLAAVAFDATVDRLWFTGDLVNRGPQSLETLRFVKGLGERAVTVLGNHDLHLLAVWHNRDNLKGSDTLDAVLAAPDAAELLAWLRTRPLLHHDPQLGFTMVHAGLSPQWDLATAQRCAGEIEAVLAGPDHPRFFKHMYGNKPRRWSESLAGWERLRYAVNCFTRMRFCAEDGTLEFGQKGAPGQQDPGFRPWFEVAGRRHAGERVVCGHWSTLGLHLGSDVFALDTGCLWGGGLTALRLPDLAVTRIDCPTIADPNDHS